MQKGLPCVEKHVGFEQTETFFPGIVLDGVEVLRDDAEYHLVPDVRFCQQMAEQSASYRGHGVQHEKSIFVFAGFDVCVLSLC